MGKDDTERRRRAPQSTASEQRDSGGVVPASNSLQGSKPTVRGRELVFNAKTMNRFLTCPLCKGYLIDATSIDPCLHTFCKSCIYKDWERMGLQKACPVCGEVLGPNPAHSLKADHTMQNLAYILVPNLEKLEQAAAAQQSINGVSNETVDLPANGDANMEELMSDGL
ncbi:uncharacterized protein EV422DRAFT_244943 [Fimicolochytrium jonesii]|uniref:uncharacterized protein n=1 Tax=Fimicolochytrium jonesii TaxID=1396493 RepID=UPI0022FE4746|nr:uncharacterized protein EV422DRAFT_244943 [Fimicolochytrium jonesii]KAI8825092.1 hypothetical protein EV422DRAFT_244943 [Fimicolochytrium jonesii]